MSIQVNSFDPFPPPGTKRDLIFSLSVSASDGERHDNNDSKDRP